MQILKRHISQGSVATRFGCGGILNDCFIANFPLSMPVKEFWKSVNICWSYYKNSLVCSFWPILYTHFVCRLKRTWHSQAACWSRFYVPYCLAYSIAKYELCEPLAAAHSALKHTSCSPAACVPTSPWQRKGQLLCLYLVNGDVRGKIPSGTWGRIQALTRGGANAVVPYRICPQF